MLFYINFSNVYVLNSLTSLLIYFQMTPITPTRMWTNAQPDGRPAKHRWHPLFNAAKSG